MGFHFNKELNKSKASMAGQTEHEVPADLPPLQKNELTLLDQLMNELTLLDQLMKLPKVPMKLSEEYQSNIRMVLRQSCKVDDQAAIYMI